MNNEEIMTGVELEIILKAGKVLVLLKKVALVAAY